MASSDILIVDDEADICELVAGLLQDEGHTTRTARDSDTALNEIKGRRPNLVFLDIWLQGSRLDGLQLLDSVNELHPELPFGMISVHGNIETTVAAITPERMEIELFGVDQSNGSHERQVGALEEAHGGTLFIDEIADMPRDTQSKILRVLVDQTFQRVGGSTKVAVDVRIVSSTSRNIEQEIAAGRFREDLFHRLSVVPIRVPPLAERREDIPDLVNYFMEQISVATGL